MTDFGSETLVMLDIKAMAKLDGVIYQIKLQDKFKSKKKVKPEGMT